MDLLSRDRIYYLEIEITQAKIEFTKPRSNLLSRDRIYYFEIEFIITRSNLLSEDQIYWVEIPFSKRRSNLLSRDWIYYPEMDALWENKVLSPHEKFDHNLENSISTY